VADWATQPICGASRDKFPPTGRYIPPDEPPQYPYKCKYRKVGSDMAWCLHKSVDVAKCPSEFQFPDNCPMRKKEICMALLPSVWDTEQPDKRDETDG
jgi:hypothetical protein